MPSDCSSPLSQCQRCPSGRLWFTWRHQMWPHHRQSVRRSPSSKQFSSAGLPRLGNQTRFNGSMDIKSGARTRAQCPRALSWPPRRVASERGARATPPVRSTNGHTPLPAGDQSAAALAPCGAQPGSCQPAGRRGEREEGTLQGARRRPAAGCRHPAGHRYTSDNVIHARRRGGAGQRAGL